MTTILFSSASNSTGHNRLFEIHKVSTETKGSLWCMAVFNLTPSLSWEMIEKFTFCKTYIVYPYFILGKKCTVNIEVYTVQSLCFTRLSSRKETHRSQLIVKMKSWCALPLKYILLKSSDIQVSLEKHLHE